MPDAPRVHLAFTPAQLNTVLLALGRLPYAEVHALIAQVQGQAGPQLVELAGGTAATAGDPGPAATRDGFASGD